MDTNTIRKKFLSFFEKQGHTVVPSSSLIPTNDPTLLFTNAGMVQFKDVFLGIEKRPYQRATTAQRCLRAGGKHNDLENVGYTARHHTFFEMLGNFSFGDYFKEEAIRFAWAFLTQELKFPPEKLWVTVYEEDDEAADIWLKKLGIDPQRFSRCGKKDNFWSMGDTGPCGPCSEIFYDHGPDIWGGPPGSPDAEGDRYIEIWNLVFMQFDRNAEGQLTPLPKPSVDTGMGLERLAAVLQGVHSNYEIDLFQRLIHHVATLLQHHDLTQPSLRVVADHIRACAFLITDGVVPSNEGRGYVLRRIIRRAIRHGNKLGASAPFFYQLVKPLVAEMGEAYPTLAKAAPQIERLLQQEEIQFARTLDQGLRLLETELSALKEKIIPGELLFKLYDTYGFPVDLTADIAREKGLSVDLAGFEAEMSKQRQLSQSASRFDAQEKLAVEETHQTAFCGYEDLTYTTQVLQLFYQQAPVKQLSAGQSGVVVLAQTPFYAESGGQVGDVGELRVRDAVFTVKDTKKQGTVHLHEGILVNGNLNVGDTVEAWVNETKRRATMLNHSATHLLHAALRKILGEHVTQKGSLVAPDKLRFDYAHFEALSTIQIDEIERLVNAQIRANHHVDTQITSPEAAQKAGAMALFGEKYGDSVRVLSMGDFSKELCGGTHVERTGEIGLFKITQETGIAAGVRRIEALTGENAVRWSQDLAEQLSQAAILLKANPQVVPQKIAQLLEQKKQQERQIASLTNELVRLSLHELLEKAVIFENVHILSCEIKNIQSKQLRDMMDQLKQRLKNAVIVLATTSGEQVHLIAGVTTNTVKTVKAGELVGFVAQQIGGKGGGRPDLAQAGGTQPEHLKKALVSVFDWVKAALQKK